MTPAPGAGHPGAGRRGETPGSGGGAAAPAPAAARRDEVRLPGAAGVAGQRRDRGWRLLVVTEATRSTGRDPLPTPKPLQPGGPPALIGGGMGETKTLRVYAAVGALTGWEPSLGWMIQPGIHVGELAAVIAVALSGAAGSGRPACIGLGAAMLGQAILVVAELVFPRDPDLGDALFGVGPVLSGAGLVVAGIAVLRARRWTDPARFAPVTVGIYTLLVLIPALVVSDGPPAPVALWTISGWACCGPSSP